MICSSCLAATGDEKLYTKIASSIARATSSVLAIVKGIGRVHLPPLQPLPVQRPFQ